MADDYILMGLFIVLCILGIRFWNKHGQEPQSFSAGPGTYVIGRNIPAGKFDLVAEEGSGDFCVLEYNALDWHHPQKLGYEGDDRSRRFRNLTLKRGDTLEINGNLWITTRNAMPISDVSQEPLEPGNYKIGLDLPAGTYNVRVLLGEGSIFNDVKEEDGKPFFQEMAVEDKEKASRYNNLYCEEGSTLYVRGNLQLQLRPSQKNRPWRFFT